MGTQESPLPTTLKIPEHVVYRELDGEAVVLNLESGYYFSLNEVGSRFWRELEQGHSFQQIVGRLLAEYEVSVPELTRDLKALVVSLKEERLVEDA